MPAFGVSLLEERPALLLPFLTPVPPEAVRLFLAAPIALEVFLLEPDMLLLDEEDLLPLLVAELPFDDEVFAGEPDLALEAEDPLLFDALLPPELLEELLAEDFAPPFLDAPLFDEDLEEVPRLREALPLEALLRADDFLALVFLDTAFLDAPFFAEAFFAEAFLEAPAFFAPPFLAALLRDLEEALAPPFFAVAFLEADFLDEDFAELFLAPPFLEALFEEPPFLDTPFLDAPFFAEAFFVAFAMFNGF